jgi:predicted Rossmann fold flavoprotein
MPQDVIAYFESIGVSLKVERGNRVFPVSDRAPDVVDALKRALKAAGVPVIRATVKALRFEDGRCVGAVTTDGRVFSAKTTLVATGGVSYPLTGSTGDGYRFAESAGHTIVPPTPSLIPLETQETWCKAAAGLTLKNVRLRLLEKEKIRYEEQGEVMLTEYGLSGPLTLSASTRLKHPFAPDQYTVEIDLKPALTGQQLGRRLLREFTEDPNLPLGQILRRLLPAQLIDPFCTCCELSPDLRANAITRTQRSIMIQQMKGMTLHIRNTRPIAEAIITRGGIPVKELDSKTMASKKMEGLYFAGEIIDTDGVTGGFNLQIAFSTAHAAGIAMHRAVTEYKKSKGE